LIVVDASALVDALVGPRDAAAARLATDPALHAPHLLLLEVCQALRGLVRGGRIPEQTARRVIGRIPLLRLRLHPHALLLPRVWELRDNLTVYDATYVALAEGLGFPLLTADRRLAGAPGLRCKVELAA
jgi:predicted nucleic acid-binding protein